jgi:hypothetical protein
MKLIEQKASGKAKPESKAGAPREAEVIDAALLEKSLAGRAPPTTRTTPARRSRWDASQGRAEIGREPAARGMSTITQGDDHEIVLALAAGVLGYLYYRGHTAQDERSGQGRPAPLGGAGGMYRPSRPRAAAAPPQESDSSLRHDRRRAPMSVPDGETVASVAGVGSRTPSGSSSTSWVSPEALARYYERRRVDAAGAQGPAAVAGRCPQGGRRLLLPEEHRTSSLPRSSAFRGSAAAAYAAANPIGAVVALVQIEVIELHVWAPPPATSRSPTAWCSTWIDSAVPWRG